MPELAWPGIRGLALPRISVPRISLPELAWPNVRIPYLQMRWRPVAMGLLLLTVPLAAYFMGRAFGLNQNRGAIIARANVASGARPVPQPVQDTSTSQPAPEQPTAPADNLAVAIPPAIPDEPPAQPSISASRDRTLAVAAARRARPLKIPPLAPTLRTGAPALPEPPRVTPRSSMESLPSIIAGMPSLPSVHAEGVTAYVKPAPSSGIRHAFRKIFTGSHDAEDFVPATPLEHPLPAVPREDIPDNATVEFVARIDRTGAVAHVKFAEGNHQLTSASARALSQWRFQPARQNGAPVDSDLLVRFEFRRRH
jgi:protein TonB